MDNKEMYSLAGMVLAPWIQKASALVGVRRRVGGNQFRHCMAAMTILIDYHFVDSTILKASIIHDLLEDFNAASRDEIRGVDAEGEKVLELVLELTRDPKKETKKEYFNRLIHSSSSQAKIIKLADRISNLTDLHLFVFSEEKTESYLNQTEDQIYPMIDMLLASDIPDNQKKMVKEMKKEMQDLILLRRTYLREFHNTESIRLKLMKMVRLGNASRKID
jgi:(p)ppGpp synthase/HD superfamily hydrolase